MDNAFRTLGATNTLGAALRVGDTIAVWWMPLCDTITALAPHPDPNHLYAQGAQLASFKTWDRGWIIDNSKIYELIARSEDKSREGAANATYRVWHIPQMPGPAFYVPVASLDAALLVLATLANYDTFQFERHIKPDYANVSGLEVLEDGEWVEWTSDSGDSVDDLLMRQRA